MIKGCVIWPFLSEENTAAIRAAAEANGYDLLFCDIDEASPELIGDSEVAFCPYPEQIAMMPRLRWCHTSSAGVDSLVRAGLFRSGNIKLTNSSGAFGLAISEHVIMMALMLMRRMPEYMGIMSRGEWKQDLRIRSISGSRIAIIGTGDLGSNAAKRFKALGAASVTGYNRSGREVPGFDAIYKAEDLMKDFGSHMAGIDVLVLCVPGTSETERLLSRERIDALSAETYVINVGRGTAIDQDALVQALNEGRLAGAALDVMVPEPLPMDHPLRTARNCILTPHSSGDNGLPYSVDAGVGIFCENLRRYASGEALINLIDIAKGY